MAMHEYKIPLGYYFTYYLQQMLKIAHETKETVFCFFGERKIVVTPGMELDPLIREIEAEAAQAHQNWESSAAGQLAAQKAAQRRQTAQTKIDLLVTELLSLDFTDLGIVLDWLCRFQDPSNTTGLNKRTPEVFAAFGKHDMTAQYAEHETYPGGETSQEQGKFLACLALAWLKHAPHAIHPIFHDQVETWRRNK